MEGRRAQGQERAVGFSFHVFFASRRRQRSWRRRKIIVPAMQRTAAASVAIQHEKRERNERLRERTTKRPVGLSSAHPLSLSLFLSPSPCRTSSVRHHGAALQPAQGCSACRLCREALGREVVSFPPCALSIRLLSPLRPPVARARLHRGCPALILAQCTAGRLLWRNLRCCPSSRYLDPPFRSPFPADQRTRMRWRIRRRSLPCSRIASPVAT